MTLKNELSELEQLSVGTVEEIVEEIENAKSITPQKRELRQRISSLEEEYDDIKIEELSYIKEYSEKMERIFPRILENIYVIADFYIKGHPFIEERKKDGNKIRIHSEEGIRNGLKKPDGINGQSIWSKVEYWLKERFKIGEKNKYLDIDFNQNAVGAYDDSVIFEFGKNNLKKIRVGTFMYTYCLGKTTYNGFLEHFSGHTPKEFVELFLKEMLEREKYSSEFPTILNEALIMIKDNLIAKEKELSEDEEKVGSLEKALTFKKSILG